MALHFKYHRISLGVLLLTIAGCMSSRAKPALIKKPTVAPATQPVSAKPLDLDSSQIWPMYHEKLAIDLPVVIKVAMAQNFEILQARQEVLASRGHLESTVGAAFPALVPTVLFEHIEGTVRATEGNLVGVGFNTFQPSIAVQWVLNPARVIYEIIAARKSLSATEYLHHAVVLEVLRSATIQYYDLILAQASVSAVHQAVSEAEELYRINQLRLKTGTGLPADVLRAEARLAGRRQDMALALNAFYQASVALAVTLHLDSSVTIIPNIKQLLPITLVRSELQIDDLLELAVVHRPDLTGVRLLAEAAAASSGATWWGAFGPQFQVNYQYSGITGHANNVVKGQGIPGNLIVNPFSSSGSFFASPVLNGLTKEGILQRSRRVAGSRDQTFGFQDQQRFNSQATWRLSLSIFGDLKSADAAEQQTVIEAQRQLDQVLAEVIQASQASKTNSELIAMAQQQVVAAAEALRLTQSNLQIGTMTTLDVLQAQDDLAQARLRYASAVVRYNQSQVNLLGALGLIDEEKLAVPAM